MLIFINIKVLPKMTETIRIDFSEMTSYTAAHPILRLWGQLSETYLPT